MTTGLKGAQPGPKPNCQGHMVGRVTRWGRPHRGDGHTGQREATASSGRPLSQNPGQGEPQGRARDGDVTGPPWGSVGLHRGDRAQGSLGRGVTLGLGKKGQHQTSPRRGWKGRVDVVNFHKAWDKGLLV